MRTEKQDKAIREVARKYGFQPGTSGNKRGRPKGKTDGIKKCQNMIQELLRLKVNQDTIMAMLQDLIDNDTYLFYTKFIEPNRSKSTIEIGVGKAETHPIVVNVLPPTEDKKKGK